jgi:hypothetical protein
MNATYNACSVNSVAYKMNNGSLSTNQIKSAASDTDMRAPNVSAIMRARSRPKANVLSSAPSETDKYCRELLLDVKCAYKGCVAGTPSGSKKRLSRPPRNAGNCVTSGSATALPFLSATISACSPRVVFKITTGMSMTAGGSCGVIFSQ